MKHERARRLAGSRAAPLPSNSDVAAAIGRAPTPDGVRTPTDADSAKNAHSETAIGAAGESKEWATSQEPRRKLQSPPFVAKRQSGGNFKGDPLASLFMQPKDFVKLRQKGIVRWRLNNWAQDLLQYTQAQRAAKTRTNALIELSTAELANPPSLPIRLDSKLTPILPPEGQSLVLGICVKEKPTNCLNMTD